MFQHQKTYAAGELEHGVTRDLERHPAVTENPATGAALRVVAHAAKELLRQVPQGMVIGVRVVGEFQNDGRGGMSVGFVVMTPEDAEKVAAEELILARSVAVPADPGEPVVPKDELDNAIAALDAAEAALRSAGFEDRDGEWVPPAPQLAPPPVPDVPPLSLVEGAGATTATGGDDGEGSPS